MSTATEANGFAKVHEHPFRSGLSVTQGKLIDEGQSINSEALAGGRLVVEATVNV